MSTDKKKQGERSVDLPVSVSGQITLLTDFGTTDYFVGAVKGVILTGNPAAKIIDITHDIPPQDIQAAAFTLLACYRSFASGTVHVAVVDPGVGSKRRPIVVQAGGYYFVGPDNGIFSYVLEKEKDTRVFQISTRKLAGGHAGTRAVPVPVPVPVSNTFHGRDVFAPVAGALSKGVTPERFGAEIFDAVRLDSLKVMRSRNGKLVARIINIDRFGNCVTNIDRDTVHEKLISLVVKGKRIERIRKSYANSRTDEPFAIWGSAGFLEISVRNGSAAKTLGVDRGELVVVEIDVD